jgi:hypothetical protein
VSLLTRLRPAVAVLVTAAAGGLGALATPGPAAAAACPGTGGVTVVVEYGALGGGTEVSCAPEGGRTAERLLEDTGHALTYVQRFPGFVCRINGLPADDPCVNTPPADAYWGLWWSDGESGKWSYSSLGAASLTIPAGGYVAMVWDGSAGDVRPQTGAPAHPTPTPTPTPTKKPSPTQAPTPSPRATDPATPTATVAGTATPEPTSRPSRTKTPKPSLSSSSAAPSPSAETTAPDPSAEPSSDEQTDSAGPFDEPVSPAASSDDGGLPSWVAPVVVVVLLGAAGGVAVARRRRQP